MIAHTMGQKRTTTQVRISNFDHRGTTNTFSRSTRFFYFFISLRQPCVADFSCKETGRDFRMCQEVRSLRQQLATLASFPQLLVKQEESLSKFTRELNRTRLTLRAMTHARKRDQEVFRLQQNSVKEEFFELFETTNMTLNQKREERLASLDRKITGQRDLLNATSLRLQSQEKEVRELQDQQKETRKGISALAKV